MSINKSNLEAFLNKADRLIKRKDLDLSSGEDLSIGIMNLISIEEHLFFTSQKTKDKKYLDLLDEIRRMRTELMKEIIKDYEGEVWCISKHLLAASMRLMEVGTKELKLGNKDKAWRLFDKSYKLYSLFWGINLNVIQVDQVRQAEQEKEEVKFIDEKNEEKGKESVFSKLGVLVQKAIDCCKE